MISPGKTANSLAHGARDLSKRLIFSYVIDWVVILATAAVGGVFSIITGNKRAFSLDDPAISYPHKQSDTVTVGVLLIVCILVPAAITVVISLLFVPGRTAPKSTPKALVWRRKLWEWNTAWMGLGVALAGAFMVTEGLKDLAGKPRPDLLARCEPDLSNASIARYQVGGLGKVLGEAVQVVDWHICKNQDSSELKDGFASWPSGHSSFSWAGLGYLSLFLCAKFAISIPFLSPAPYSGGSATTFGDVDAPAMNSTISGSSTTLPNEAKSAPVPARNQAAAPPVYLIIVAFVPIGTALYICCSRYTDYRHAGFDIFSGAVIGAFFAWFGFRWYHLPIQQGAGWSWGARSKNRAYYTGIGIPTYVGDEGWESGMANDGNVTENADDLEGGRNLVTGPGLADHPESETLNSGVHNKEQDSSDLDASHGKPSRTPTLNSA